VVVVFFILSAVLGHGFLVLGRGGAPRPGGGGGGGGGGPHSIGNTANSQEKSIIRIGLWRERSTMNSVSLQASPAVRGTT
jgi:hypothetical protein